MSKHVILLSCQQNVLVRMYPKTPTIKEKSHKNFHSTSNLWLMCCRIYGIVIFRESIP